ncbi:MAG: MoxR family ATPase [Alphaproteobacteria bacterium]
MPEADYRFDLIDGSREGPTADSSVLFRRPFVDQDASFKADARLFVAGAEMDTALNAAVALGEPLLITGEPGTGKTQAAYYAAYKLGIEPVIHFQVKSESKASDLLYHFDTIRYFRDAHLARTLGSVDGDPLDALDKTRYVEHRPLWEAMVSETPRVLLIDEIDKAPRDFPNDLLLELDKMEFTITELNQKVQAPSRQRPVVVITSNSERRLPEPFLRRCIYHHIVFDESLIGKAVERRRGQYLTLSDEFLALAIRRFLALRERNLRKRPALGELLVWLRALALATDTEPGRLNGDLADLPYLGVLLKNHQDIEDLSRR